jgi:diguanylate cyclase (GGDEF)-like protein
VVSSRLLRWVGNIGSDDALAVAQVVYLRRQVPLLYGLLLINSLAVAITHLDDAPSALTISAPSVLFAITFLRMIKWVRESRKGAPDPLEAKRQLRLMTTVAGPVALAYICWALALSPYGGPYEQAHVGLYISTTVIGCIFCLAVLPQAALVVAVTVLPAFLVFCFAKHTLIFITIGINVSLVLAVLLRVLLNSFEHFRSQIRSSEALVTQHQELQRLNDENQALALTDSLTSLPNRRKFYADLDALTAQEDGGSAFAVGVLDLDRFKLVNDTYGHQVGDRLLAALGGRLHAAASPFSRVYRLGGDEFGVIDLGGDKESLARLLQQVEAPLHVGEITLKVGGSLGIAHYPQAGNTAAELFDRADYALYHAKHVNGGGLCVFTPSLETSVRADQAIEIALQSNTLSDEINVVLQPIVALATGQVQAVEVLARWNSPLLGQVSASDFIPIAERSTAIHSITKAVVKKGLEAARLLPKDVAVSLNISACDLSSAITLAFIQKVIQEAKVDPSRIWIEVTETAVMRDADAAAAALQSFRDIGVRVALDDFGTGYSSLGYLEQLPLDKIKIDRSFVNALEKGRGSAIVQAMITLCQTIGIECIAEGVETARQRDILRDAGCEQAQGYFFNQPLPINDLLVLCPRRFGDISSPDQSEIKEEKVGSQKIETLSPLLLTDQRSRLAG